MDQNLAKPGKALRPEEGESVEVDSVCVRMVNSLWPLPAESQHSPSNFTLAASASSLPPTAGDVYYPVIPMSSLFASQAVLLQQ